MTETLSIRIDSRTKKRLDALSKRAKRSRSFLAAQAITAFVDSDDWQLREIQAGIKELDEGKSVGHDKVSGWLNTWGRSRKSNPPR